MTVRCPSDLALEHHVAGFDDSLAAHLQGCPECRTRLARFREEGARFHAVGFPKTLDRVLGASIEVPKRTASRWAWFLGVPSLAAAALSLVVQSSGPETDYRGTKGSGDFAFSVYVNRPAGAEPLDAEGRVPANAQLRFEVRPSEPCWVTVISIDGAGAVSRLYPARDAAARVDSAGPLLGGAEMDGLAGYERLFALCSPRALSTEEIERTARASFGTSPDAVRAITRLENLPADTKQATVLLQKQP